MSEFESELRRERQMAGIEAAKERGVYAQPRTPKFDYEMIRRLYEEGTKPSQIAKRLGCSNQTIYRVLADGQKAPEADAGQAEPV
jgi:DNA invertase Pin-like site-specific DNA recombinase